MSAQEITGVDDAFGNWLAGFIDGEGCFIITPPSRRFGGAPVCLFQLILRADDAEILREIHRRLGFGVFKSRRLNPYSGSRSQGNTRPQAVWRIASRADCMGLIRLLDRYPLRAKKARDFVVWRAAVVESARVFNSQPAGRRDYSRVMELAAEIRRVREWSEQPVEPQVAADLMGLTIFDQIPAA